MLKSPGVWVEELHEDVKAPPDEVFKMIVTPWYKLAVQAEKEAELRDKYPALKSAWDNYQMMLRMVSGDVSEDSES